MNWYIKLFAPLIICFVLFLVTLVAGLTDTLNQLFEKAEYLIRTVAVLIYWGVVQTLFFPGRSHKTGYRILIVLCALVYPVFVFAATSRGRVAEEWTIVLFLGAVFGLVNYYLRHKTGTYSLAPKWEEMKYISTLVAIGMGTVFTLVLLDEVLIKAVRVMRRIPQEWGIAFLVLWGIAALMSAFSYYTEAILHHKRNSDNSWDSRLDQIGKE